MNQRITKKSILIGSIAAVTIGGTILFVKSISAKAVAVTPVSVLNLGAMESPLTSSGLVIDSDVQKIMPDDTKMITQVFVQQGQPVHKGDKLLAYDLTSLNLGLEISKLKEEQIKNSILQVQHKLEVLQRTVPDTEPPMLEPLPEPEPEQPSLPEKVQDSTGAWNYIDSLDQAEASKENEYPSSSQGSMDNPHIFHVMKDGFVCGSLFNQIRNENIYLRFDIYAEDTFVASWFVVSSYFPECRDEDEFSILTHSTVLDENDSRPETQPSQNEEKPQESGYTAAELAKEIMNQKHTLKTLNLDLKKAQLKIQQDQENLTDGIVYAKQDGIVTKVGDMNALPTDGSSFLEVAGGNGLYAEGSISELMLDRVQVGMEVDAINWNNGKNYKAKITSIDTYPTDNTSGYQGNPNASYYTFQAYIENTDNLSAGDYIDFSFQDTSEQKDSIWLDLAYVRRDGSKYYVMKAGKDGKLVRQNIKTGKMEWGSAVEVLDGLTLEDQITFPYGKKVKEGVPTQSDLEDDMATMKGSGI